MAEDIRVLDWQQALVRYLSPKALIMLLLGFCSGLPLLLIFSSLSLWLVEAGVERSMVTQFSWAALGYSFKFIWAPLIDALPLPFVSRLLGRRKAWLFVAQLAVVLAIVAMSLAAPASGSLQAMAWAAVGLGFASATQDIVIDAYRIELAPDDAALQSVMAATYSAGYRLGMIVAGAGSLALAQWLGSSKEHYVYEAWRHTYWLMATLMGLGALATLFLPEPEVNEARAVSVVEVGQQGRLVVMFVCAVVGFVLVFRVLGMWLPEMSVGDVWWGQLAGVLREGLRLLGGVLVAGLVGMVMVRLRLVSAGVVRQTWLEPLADFFRRYGRGALVLLALIGLYRISDIVAGVISNVFYENMGFTKIEIARAVKTFGVLMSIVGGFLGGMLAQRFAIMRMMFLGAVLASATNLLFMGLALRGHDVPFMYLAVGMDNLAAGLAGAVFVAFLSSLTNIRFTAVQYALFSSLMNLLPKILGGYSGAIVDGVGYQSFFLFTALLGVPIIVLIILAGRYLRVQ